ncbi:MAG: shikimate kinase [Acidimicrobiales bacterium]
MARLVLVGLPATGKTAVARALADAWGCAYVDTDALVEERVGCPAAQYLRRHGEVAFRDQELEALREALGQDAVVSTGGGIVTTPRARTLLAGESTYWLDCELDEIMQRLGEDDRPLLADDPRSALERLREQRSAWYLEVSRARIDASGTLEQVTRRVRDAAQKDEK